MRVRLDDDLYRIDRTYLGPKGKPIPVHATYQQWAVFIGVLVVSWIALRVARFSFGPTLGDGLTQGSIWILASWWVAGRLKRVMSADRPFLDEVIRIVQELTAPRPRRQRTIHLAMVLEVAVYEPWAVPEPTRWQRARGWIQGRLHLPSSDLPSSDQASSDQASSDQASSDQASSDQASSDLPSSDQPSSDSALHASEGLTETTEDRRVNAYRG